MSTLSIAIADDKHAFKPSDSLAGRVSWGVSAVTSAELKLFWYTRGRGKEDVGLVDTLVFENPQTNDQRQFKFNLPDTPYSFAGKLISIVWAIELIVEPETAVERREFVMSPTGKEVDVAQESPQ
jgi:hypothetical protein